MNNYIGYNRSALGKLKIILSIDDTTTADNNVIDLISVGKISIGDDNEKEFTFFPNKLSLKIRFEVTELALVSIADKLFTYPVKVAIYKDKLNNDTYSTPVIVTDLDKQSLKIDIIERTIELTGIDELIGLKLINPQTNPLSLALGSAAYRTVFILEEILKLGNINSTTIVNNLEGRISDSGGIHYIPFSDWYTVASLYFDANSYYEDLFSLLRNILLNYCLAGYINLEREFIAQSYIPYSFTTRPISILKIIGDYKYIIKDNCNKITVNLFNGSAFSSDVIEVSAPEEIAEEFRIVQLCGWDFSYNNSWSGVLAAYLGASFSVDPYTSGGLKWGPVRAKISATEYSYDKSLWEYPLLVLTGKTNERLGGLKYQIELTADGLDHNIIDYYQLPYFGSSLFRAAKIEYDLIKGQSKLFLRSTFSPSELLTINPSAISGESPVTNPPEKLG